MPAHSLVEASMVPDVAGRTGRAEAVLVAELNLEVVPP